MKWVCKYSLELSHQYTGILHFHLQNFLSGVNCLFPHLLSFPHTNQGFSIKLWWICQLLFSTVSQAGHPVNSLLLQRYHSCRPHPPIPTTCVLVAQSCLTLQCRGLGPTRLLCPWDSPGKNTGMGNHSLLQGIFLTQGLNPGLLHRRNILYCLSHQGNPVSSQALSISLF